MRKSISIATAIVLCMLILVACGSEEQIIVSTIDIIEETPEEQVSEDNSKETVEIKQVVSNPIEIKLLDEKHADFLFDLNLITGKDVKANNVMDLTLSFPESECELCFEGDCPAGDGSDETIPPHAYGNFEGGYGCLGEVEFEVNDEHIVILHLSLTEPEVIDIATIASDSDKCELTLYMFDDDNEYLNEYLFSDIVNRSGFESRYADEINAALEVRSEDDDDDVPSQGHVGDPSSVSLNDFVGEYRGINPFFVSNWDTYEMSEDVDHSLLTIKKTTDGCEFTDFVLDSDKAPKRHENLSPITLKESEMEYFLDDGQEDLWDCLRVDSEYGLIILSKRQKDGQLVVAIDFGGVPQMYIPR